MTPRDGKYSSREGRRRKLTEKLTGNFYDSHAGVFIPFSGTCSCVLSLEEECPSFSLTSLVIVPPF